MYKGKSFLAVIPARGGSKGIPRKNLALVNNKPLIQYTIDEALSSKYLDEIIVSTDNIEIAKVAQKLGVSVPYLRPTSLANDHSKTIDAVLHVINEQKKLEKEYDYVVLLQPTQPLRKAWHIDESIEKIINYNSENLVSISQVKEHPILMRTISEDREILRNLLNTESTVRRQDFSKVYKVNGAIYINKISSLGRNTSLNDNNLPYHMEKRFDLDIDDFDDIELFDWIIKKGV